jgi:hypothetical protein
MGTSLRAVTIFVAGVAATLLLERRRARRRRGELLHKILARVRPTPVADDAVEAQVRRTLARHASEPNDIAVSIEHGCVDLRGPVETHERARLVRAVATVRGVDAVLDLMTEPAR